MVDREGNPVSGAEVVLALLTSEDVQASRVSSVSSSSGSLPIPDIEVQDLAFFRAFSTDADSQAQHRVQAKSGISGEFSMEQVPQIGSAVLKTEAEGFLSAYLKVALADKNEEQTVVLTRGIPVRGRVVTATGQAVGDALVRVMGQTWSGSGEERAPLGGASLHGMGGFLPVESRRTDQRGEFTLTVEHHGSLALHVESPSCGQDHVFGPADGFTGSSGTPYPRPGRPSADESRGTMGPRQRVVSWLLRVLLLRPAESVTSDGAHFGSGGGFGTRDDNGPRATVDQDGTYRIDGVEPGCGLDVSITDAKGILVAQGLHVATLNPGQSFTWNYTITEAMLIRGVVRGKASGKPLSDILVTCEQADESIAAAAPSAQATTRADGQYELRVYSAPGAYRVTPMYKRDDSIAHPTIEDACAVDVNVKAGAAPSAVDLVLPDPCARSFLVVDAQGKTGGRLLGASAGKCERQLPNLDMAWPHARKVAVYESADCPPIPTSSVCSVHPRAAESAPFATPRASSRKRR